MSSNISKKKECSIIPMSTHKNFFGTINWSFSMMCSTSTLLQDLVCYNLLSTSPHLGVTSRRGVEEVLKKSCTASTWWVPTMHFKLCIYHILLIFLNSRCKHFHSFYNSIKVEFQCIKFFATPWYCHPKPWNGFSLYKNTLFISVSLLIIPLCTKKRSVSVTISKWMNEYLWMIAYPVQICYYI